MLKKIILFVILFQLTYYVSAQNEPKIITQRSYRTMHNHCDISITLQNNIYSIKNHSINDSSNAQKDDISYLGHNIEENAVVDFLKSYPLNDAFPDALAIRYANILCNDIIDFERNNSTERRNADIGILLDSLEADMKNDYAGMFRYNKEAYPDNLIPLFRNYTQTTDTFFKIESIRIQIDYLKIYDIRAVGWIVYNLNGQQQIIRRVAFSNNINSITIKSLHENDNNFLNESKFLNTDYSYQIRLKGLVTFEPKGSSYSYMLSNHEYAIESKNNFEENIIYANRKKLTDYLSLQIFLDPLGFMNEKPNGFAQLEGSVSIPLSKSAYDLNPCNKRKVYSSLISSQVSSSLSYIYANSINQEPRFSKIFISNTQIDSSKNPIDSTHTYDTTRIYSLNNLDFVRNYFYLFNTRYYLFTQEIKSWNAWFHISTGVKLWGSRIGTHRDSLHSFHRLFLEYLNIALEIRPDKPFGMNLNLGIGTLNKFSNGNGTNILLGSNSINFVYGKSIIIPHEVNFYYKLSNVNNGGLYFRYSGYIASNRNSKISNSTEKVPKFLKNNSVDFFPTILIGYATNISSLIKGEFGKNR